MKISSEQYTALGRWALVLYTSRLRNGVGCEAPEIVRIFKIIDSAAQQNSEWLSILCRDTRVVREASGKVVRQAPLNGSNAAPLETLTKIFGSPSLGDAPKSLDGTGCLITWCELYLYEYVGRKILGRR